MCCNIDKVRKHFADEEQSDILQILDMVTITCLPVCLSNYGLWVLSIVSRSSRSCLSELQISLLHRLPLPSHTVQGTNKTDSRKFTKITFQVQFISHRKYCFWTCENRTKHISTLCMHIVTTASLNSYGDMSLSQAGRTSWPRLAAAQLSLANVNRASLTFRHREFSI